MMARGLTTAVLLAFAIAGTANAQAVKSDETARPDAPSAQISATLPATNNDPSDAATAIPPASTPDPSASTAAPAPMSDPVANDAGLPNAPQAKKPIVGYQRPSEKVKLVNYLFDAYGPFPLVGSALVAGINQADNSPRDWDQGIRGYGRRWGSDFGIGAITTSTRYGLAELLREDTLYYRCECSGFFPRMRHALISTFTGRRGEDGHRVFSIPSLVAPYVGELVAVNAW